MQGLKYGEIVEVYPPNHSSNRSKYQYEYKVMITSDGYSQIPCFCTRMDSYGSYHNFEDAILAPGYRVLVMFPREEGTIGVIIGGIRTTVNKPINPSEGYFYRQRFNEVETFISKVGTWQVRSDDGPYASISKDEIILDDAKGQKISLDRSKQVLTINATALTILVQGDATITVNKNLTATVLVDANVNVTKNAVITADTVQVTAKNTTTLTSDGDTTVNAKNCRVNAKGNVDVKAKLVKLNGEGGTVLTDKLNPVVDYLTGIKSVGVPTVKSGD